MTVIIKKHTDEQTVLSSASEKDILDCVGTTVPFYDRTLEQVSSTKGTNELESRYTILRNNIDPRESDIIKIDPYYVIKKSGKNVLLSLKGISLFELVSVIDKHDINTVYMPRISPIERRLLEKSIYGIPLHIFEMDEGDVRGEVL